jgi:hypothetical protein
MREDLTDITFVLDRSGSMESIRDDTAGGFNSFVAEQAKLPGECRISLVQFDDKYEPNYSNVLAAHIKPLDRSTYQPRGWTALVDAVGKTIVATGERLKAMPEAQRPGKVIFVIITDGQENASHEYVLSVVQEMIQTQEKQFNWQFVFLGAGIDAVKDAKAYGYTAGKSLNVGKTSAGVQRAMRRMSENIGSYRASGQSAVMDWSGADRSDQDAEGAVSTTDPVDPNSTTTP